MGFDNDQIAVGTAINNLISFAIVGHKGSVISFDFSIVSVVGTAQSQLGTVDKSLGAVEGCPGCHGHFTVIKGMSTFENQSAVSTVVKPDTFLIGNGAVIIIGGSSESSLTFSCSGEGHSGRTAHHAGDVGNSGNAEAVGQSMVAADRQVVVGACVNFGISTVVFNIAAVDGGVIAFSISAAVEGHGHTGGNILSAADQCALVDCESLGKSMSPIEGQSGITSADDSLIDSLIGS